MFFAHIVPFITFVFAVSHSLSRMPTVPKIQRTRAQRKFYLHQSRPAQVKAREAARQDRRVVILDKEERTESEIPVQATQVVEVETRPDEIPMQDTRVVVVQPEAEPQAQSTQPGHTEAENDSDSDAISIMASDTEI